MRGSMGIGIEDDVWNMQDKIRDRIESHKINERAKNGFVFILDNLIETVHLRRKKRGSPHHN